MLRSYINNAEKLILGALKKLFYKSHFDGSGKLYADHNSIFILDKGSKIEIDKLFHVNKNNIVSNKRSSLIRLDKEALLHIKGVASIFYDADIIVFEKAKLTIGNSFINSNCKIRCHKRITIGDGCAISHDFSVMDSDAHALFGDKNEKEVIIGDNVWIGTRVTVLSGVSIGNGAVIAAGSLVNEDVPEKCLVAGVPARVIREDVEWSR